MSFLLQLDEKPVTAIREVMRTVISDATKFWAPLRFEGPYPLKGFGVSKLRPRTVGVASDYWSASVTTSFADWVNHTLGDNEYVVVGGVFNFTPDPQITAIFPKANGQDLPIVDIEMTHAFEGGIAFLPKPFAIKPNNNVTIQIVGRTAGTERFGLEGYEVAKRSLLIDSTP